MTVGLGIFLSTLLISIIYLHQTNKFRLNWKRICKITAIILIVAPLLIFSWLWLSNKYDTFPRQTDTYWGIKLGETKAGVLFFKGLPSAKVSSKFDGLRMRPVKLNNKFDKYKVSEPVAKSTDESSQNIWIYNDSEKTYQIKFTDDDKVEKISCYCLKKYCSFACHDLFSIGINSSFDKVLRIFGEPSGGYNDTEYGERLLKYPKYNIFFNLQKGEVNMIGIGTKLD